MRRWAQLNDKQLDVLKRVDAGEDLAGPEHQRLRQSANTARNRGLITISRRGGVWRAEMTEAGRFYLEHGGHPDDPKFAEVAPSTKPMPKPAVRAGSPARATPTPCKPPARFGAPHTPQQRRADALALIKRLEAERRFIVTAPSDEEVAKWRKTVNHAKRYGLVPEGHYIQTTRRLWSREGDLQIELVHGVHANTKAVEPEMPPVPVPDALRKPHPVVADLRDDAGRLMMPKDLRRRALLVLQGLVAEAVSRGHQVTKHPVPEHQHHHWYGYGPRPTGPRYSRREGELYIVTGGFNYTVTLRQVSPNSADPERKQLLAIELGGFGVKDRKHRWLDGKRRTVEDGLAALLLEVETRAVEDQQRKLAEERSRVERRSQWEQAMVRAKDKAVQAHYAQILDGQVAAWQRAKELRAYRDALKARLAAGEDEVGVARAEAWVQWIDEYIAKVDPAQALPRMPPPPEIPDKDLTPFLGGWSSHGPEEPAARPVATAEGRRGTRATAGGPPAGRSWPSL